MGAAGGTELTEPTATDPRAPQDLRPLRGLRVTTPGSDPAFQLLGRLLIVGLIAGLAVVSAGLFLSFQATDGRGGPRTDASYPLTVTGAPASIRTSLPPVTLHPAGEPVVLDTLGVTLLNAVSFAQAGTAPDDPLELNLQVAVERTAAGPERAIAFALGPQGGGILSPITARLSPAIEPSVGAAAGASSEGYVAFRTRPAAAYTLYVYERLAGAAGGPAGTTLASAAIAIGTIEERILPPAPTPTPTPVPTPTPSLGPAGGSADARSTSIAGFGATRRGLEFTGVHGSWNEPDSPCTGKVELSARMWVGFGATAGRSVKVGTSVRCHEGAGDAEHEAWYQGPDGKVVALALGVRANDELAADITLEGTNLRVRLSNRTSGYEFSTDLAEGTPGAAVFWAIDSKAADGTYGNLTFLPALKFDGCSATAREHPGSITDDFWNVTRYTLISAGGATRAEPSEPSKSGSGFELFWRAP